MSFTNVATGTKILDNEYRYFINARIRDIAREACKVRTAAQSEEDTEEVSEFIVDNDTPAFRAFYDNDCQHAGGLDDAAGNIPLADIEECLERFEDAYAGEWENEEDYVENAIQDGLFGDTSEGPLGNYVDVESLTRDLFISDMFSLVAPGGMVFAYHNC